MKLADPSPRELNMESAGSPELAMASRPVRRRIDQDSGRALEIIGHAIEYLTDEYVHEFAHHERSSFSAHDGRLQAIQLLMAANREIYFQCPEVEDLMTRVLSILSRRSRKVEGITRAADV
jgi:hypothetical protein